MFVRTLCMKTSIMLTIKKIIDILFERASERGKTPVARETRRAQVC